MAPPTTKYTVINTSRLLPSSMSGLRAPISVTGPEVLGDRALRRLRIGALAMQQLAPPLPPPLLNSKEKGDREAAAYEAARVGLGGAHMWVKGQVAAGGEGKGREVKVEVKEERWVLCGYGVDGVSQEVTDINASLE